MEATRRDWSPGATMPQSPCWIVWVLMFWQEAQPLLLQRLVATRLQQLDRQSCTVRERQKAIAHIAFLPRYASCVSFEQ